MKLGPIRIFSLLWWTTHRRTWVAPRSLPILYCRWQLSIFRASSRRNLLPRHVCSTTLEEEFIWWVGRALQSNLLENFPVKWSLHDTTSKGLLRVLSYSKAPTGKPTSLIYSLIDFASNAIKFDKYFPSHWSATLSTPSTLVPLSFLEKVWNLGPFFSLKFFEWTMVKPRDIGPVEGKSQTKSNGSLQLRKHLSSLK